jgi:hypothetical protein
MESAESTVVETFRNEVLATQRPFLLAGELGSALRYARNGKLDTNDAQIRAMPLLALALALALVEEA